MNRGWDLGGLGRCLYVLRFHMSPRPDKSPIHRDRRDSKQLGLGVLVAPVFYKHVAPLGLKDLSSRLPVIRVDLRRFADVFPVLPFPRFLASPLSRLIRASDKIVLPSRPTP